MITTNTVRFSRPPLEVNVGFKVVNADASVNYLVLTEEEIRSVLALFKPPVEETVIQILVTKLANANSSLVSPEWSDNTYSIYIQPKTRTFADGTGSLMFKKYVKEPYNL